MLTLGVVALASPAQATFPGANGRIAFSTDFSDDPQIFTVNSNGSGETQITFDDSGHASAPDWSPDGTQIAFQGDLTGEWEIYVMDADGGNRQQLTIEPGIDHLNPRFSPDGQKIAFGGCPGQDVPCAIYVMNADGSGMTQLTSLVWSSFNPEFSPDGTKIAFDSNMDGFLSAVWVMNTDGSNQHRLTAPDLEAFYPDWSPDGTHILFTTNCCLPYSNVWVMNADGSGLKQLTHFPRSTGGGGFASYSPDGKKIVLVSGFKHRDDCCGDLYTMDANGTHLTRIVADQPAVFFSDWGEST
jgi:Tol biopolymer transport system component